jgi:predicted alpha/beta superfamily hydrolase
MSEILEGSWVESENPDLVDAKIITSVFNDHRVDVYVPDEVTAQTPVLVMHDGKNLFWPEFSTTGHTWGVIPVVQQLAVRPVVIGVWIKDEPEVPMIRLFELTPENVIVSDPNIWTNMLAAANAGTGTPIGNEYHRLLVQEIVPSVATEVGLGLDRERTALCGSSMGGLTSLYGAALYPDFYGTVLALSTHWAYWDRKIIPDLLSMLSHNPRARIWTDRGTQEIDAMYEGLHEEAADYLRSNGWVDGVQLQAHVYPGTNHSEPVWRDRLPEILQWWLS